MLTLDHLEASVAEEEPMAMLQDLQEPQTLAEVAAVAVSLVRTGLVVLADLELL
jgi:hypothetical protein